jgi:hypothetical protein
MRKKIKNNIPKVMLSLDLTLIEFFINNILNVYLKNIKK